MFESLDLQDLLSDLQISINKKKMNIIMSVLLEIHEKN